MDAVPVPVIDADGHALETDAELEQYFEGAYKYPTDFPHERQAGEFAVDIPEFWKREDLTETAKRKVLCENAKRFYNMA